MQNRIRARLSNGNIRVVRLFPCESRLPFGHAFPCISNTAWGGNWWEAHFWCVLIYIALRTDAALHILLYTGFVSQWRLWLMWELSHFRLWILPIPSTAFMNILSVYTSSTFWEDYYKPQNYKNSIFLTSEAYKKAFFNLWAITSSSFLSISVLLCKI